MPASVSIAQGDPGGSVEGAVAEALDRLDLSFLRGRLVAVKPNETATPDGDCSGVTQPDTLRAVLRAVRAQEPAAVVVTGGSGAGETADVMRTSGMLGVVEAEGAEFFDHNRAPFVEVPLSYERDPEVRGPQRAVVVNRRVLDYEALVSVAQLKLHETATVTLSLKNVAMSFPAADHYGHPRAEQQHRHAFFDDMHSFIAAMARRFPVHLAVIAGHPAMLGTGPLEGHPVETGLVLAGRDAVATDVVGARLLGFMPQAVRHLWEAGRLGLGETDLDAIAFPGLSLGEAVGAFTEAAYGRRLTFGHD
jgi:uncharacterized protein (DUF362 family)